jgi:hypothetical protein
MLMGMFMQPAESPEFANRHRDSVDDLAAFLVHRTADPGVTDEERYLIFALVVAYQDPGLEPVVEQAMKETAVRFAGHPDYHSEWRLS